MKDESNNHNNNTTTPNENKQKPKMSCIDDFTIISELGKGAFSNVYKVKRKKDNQFYALKKVNLISLTEKERENSFNEIRLLASISNANVISYKDSFIDKSKHLLYLIMEYADNGDLEQRIQEQIKKKEFLSESTILSFFEQIVRGLKALHDKSIIHRDLKAANIFLFKNDIVKIGDMNVSKIIRKGLKNTQTGTPYYASPEIWDNKQYDFKSDIWSLGCLCYEMTALKAPFRGTSMTDVYNKVIKGNFDVIPKQYSKDLLEIIKMCLKYKSDERPSCMQLLYYIKKIREAQQQGACNGEKKDNVSNGSESQKKIFKKIKLSLDMKDINVNLPLSRYESKLRLRNNSKSNIRERLKGIRRYYKNTSHIHNQTEIQDLNINDKDNNINELQTLQPRLYTVNTSNYGNKERIKLKFNYSTNNIRTNENNDKSNKHYAHKQDREHIRTEAINKQKAQIEKELAIRKISQMKKRLLTNELKANQSKDVIDLDNKERNQSKSPIRRPPSAHYKLRLNKDLMNLTNDITEEKNKSFIKPSKDIEIKDIKESNKGEVIEELIQFNAEQSKQLAEKYLEQQRAYSSNTKNNKNKSDNIRAIFSYYNAIQTEKNMPSSSINNGIKLPQLNNGKAPVYLHTKSNNSVQIFDIFHNLIPNQQGKKIKKINLNHFNKKGYHKLQKNVIKK